MSAAALEVPTLQQEVDRKAYEALHSLLWRLEQGKITQAQFLTGVEVVHDTLNGLVSDSEFFRFVGELQKRGAPDANKDVSIHIEGKKLVIMWRRIGGEELLVIHATIDKMKRIALMEEDKPDLAATLKMKAASSVLIERGARRML